MVTAVEQMVGINEYARDFLSAHSAKMKENSHTYTSIQGTQYHLNQYILPDGSILREHVQAECGDTGGKRAIFIALRNQIGQWIPQSLWDEKMRQLAMLE